MINTMLVWLDEYIKQMEFEVDQLENIEDIEKSGELWGLEEPMDYYHEGVEHGKLEGVVDILKEVQAKCLDIYKLH